MSRTSIVAMLIAAEVLIAGMALYVVGHGGTTFAAGMHRVDFTASAIAPIAAGPAPHIVIDDADSRVSVTPSSDEQVHVRDLTEIRGAVFTKSSYPRLQVSRTPDGVRIERSAVGGLSVVIFGYSTQAIEVEVPQGSHVEIARCGGALISGITGGTSVRSVDGRITLADLQGQVDAHSDDGSLRATNVHGDSLTLATDDGRITLENVSVASLNGSTHDGSIDAQGTSVSADATLQTDDGSIKVAFAPDADLTVDASTRDGRISVDGNSNDGDDSAQRTIRLGAGTGRMKLATSDGSIHILTNGAFQSDRL
jgi:hypothetical protein